MAIQRLVLDRNRIDIDAALFESLDILDKVLRELTVILVIEVIVRGCPVHDAIQLHPPWGAPDGPEDFDGGVGGFELGEPGEHVFAFRFEIKVGEVEIYLIGIGIDSAR